MKLAGRDAPEMAASVEPGEENDLLERKRLHAERMRHLVIAGLIIILYVALAIVIGSKDGTPHCIFPGCPPPCAPPQTGCWPDCHDEEPEKQRNMSNPAEGAQATAEQETKEHCE